MSGAGTWFRTMLHQEPIIMWSCIIGGIGKHANGIIKHMLCKSPGVTCCRRRVCQHIRRLCENVSSYSKRNRYCQFFHCQFGSMVCRRVSHPSSGTTHSRVLLQTQEYQPTTGQKGISPLEVICAFASQARGDSSLRADPCIVQNSP